MSSRSSLVLSSNLISTAVYSKFLDEYVKNNLHLKIAIWRILALVRSSWKTNDTLQMEFFWSQQSFLETDHA